MIYNILAEQDSCYITQAVYLVPPMIYYILGDMIFVLSEEQAKQVSKIFPTNEIARNKICSADLLNGHEWRKVGCVVENKLEFRQ
jgi:hypothetical protein